MSRFALALLTVGVFLAMASTGAGQKTLISGLTDVYIYPIWGLGGDPFSEVKVELLDSHGKPVAAGISSSEQPVVMLKGVHIGSYGLRLSHPEMNTVTRAIRLFRSEHWFTESLLSDPPEYAYLPAEELAVSKSLGTFKGKVASMPKDGKQPMWARMMGIFSTVIMDSRIKPDGSFEFRIEPGLYVLVVARGTQVCAIQQVHSFRKLDEGPLRVILASACR